VRYLVVGNGEERSAILQRVEDMPGKVVMTGRRTDISELLTAMDALALTSLNEGLGRVIVEAMTAGVPVVATAVGGVPEILGGAGVLVPTREPEALAGALQNMLANDAFRAELVEKGRKRAERYSIESAVNSLEELYTEILRSKGQALS
jgi:glycosyltransferase involved in cell wall biosynthesis